MGKASVFHPIYAVKEGFSEVEAFEQRPERSTRACRELCGGGCSRRSSKQKGPEAEAWPVARWQENGERTRMEGQQGPGHPSHVRSLACVLQAGQGLEDRMI